MDGRRHSPDQGRANASPMQAPTFRRGDRAGQASTSGGLRARGGRHPEATVRRLGTMGARLTAGGRDWPGVSLPPVRLLVR